MGLFGKKKEVPPDIGEESEEEDEEEQEVGEEQIQSPDPGEMQTNSQASEASGLELQKIKTRIGQLQSLMQGYSEKFSQLNQQLGEVRSMSLSNEKDISKTKQRSDKAANMVKEVQPQKLYSSYQKLKEKINMLDEKINAEREFKDTVMGELNDLRKKSEAAMGSEELLKLNEEIKDDLTSAQKLTSEVRMHSSKVEEVFSELRKRYVKIEKLKETVDSLREFYNGLKERLEKLKVNYGEIVNQDDFEEFKDTIHKRFSRIENSLSSIDDVKKRNEKIGRMIENTLSIAKTNKANIDNIAVSIGNERVQKASDIESKIAEMLEIMDTLAGQVSEIRHKIGLDDEKKKVSVETMDGSGFKNLDTDISKNLKGGDNKENNDNEDEGKEEGKEGSIDEKIKEVKKLIDDNKFKEAIVGYGEIDRIYDSLPEDKKKEVYDDIKEIYDSLTG